MSVGGDDVLVAASVALYDGEVGGGMVQSVACAGVGVGGGACELGVVDGVGGHGVFLFLAWCFLLRLYSITGSPLVSTCVDTRRWGAWPLVVTWVCGYG